jgi:S-adenosylmethionine synthetase
MEVQALWTMLVTCFILEFCLCEMVDVYVVDANHNITLCYLVRSNMSQFAQELAKNNNSLYLNTYKSMSTRYTKAFINMLAKSHRPCT